VSVLFFLEVSILTFPYGLFGLQKNFYYSNNDFFYIIPKSETEIISDFFLKQIYPNNFPHKLLSFSFLFVLAFLISLKLRRHKHHDLAISFWIIILIGWFRTSYASPFSWQSSREFPISSHRVYLRSHFADGSGAVSADQPVWSTLTQVLQFGELESGLVIRRIFPNYLVSQFSYFTNSYGIWVVLNILFWFLACVSCKIVIRQMGCGRNSQSAGVFLTALSPLFTAAVGQSSAYLAGYAFFWILIAGTIIVNQTLKKGIAWVSSLTALFSLSYLVYDFYLWLPIIAVTTYKLGLGSLRSFLPVYSGSLFVFSLYRYLLVPALEIQVDAANENILINGIKNSIANLKSYNTLQMDLLIRESITKFAEIFYMVITPQLLVFALFLLVLSRSNQRKKFWGTYFILSYLYLQSIFTVIVFAGNAFEGSVPSRFYPLYFLFTLFIAQTIECIPRSRQNFFLVALYSYVLFGIIFGALHLDGISWIYYNLNLGPYRPMVW
jgi:hypothetical protein